jgi:succinylglutamic semialdehyde dehydrogenase
MSTFEYLPFAARGDYVDGHFAIPAEPEGALEDQNPGDPRDAIAEFRWHRASIDAAVAAARAAFPKWRDTPFTGRAACLKRYADALRRHKERLAQIISREMGKVLWEAMNEVDTMIAKVDVTLGDSMALVADHQPAGVKGWVRHLPRGVMAVIGPFNFPGHLPNGHIVPALATGNTVVFKPSRATPGVGQVMAECLHEAGLPPGVFNLIQIPGRHADALVAHLQVDGVLFTGSTGVGEHIRKLTLDHHWKVLALEMGGKNAAIVLDDAPFDLALYEVLTGAFLTSGQRCTATSRVILQRGIADRFAARLAAGAAKLRVGVQHDAGAFMGPLVDRAAAEDFDQWQHIARDEGAECLTAGGLMDDPPVAGGAYVRPGVHRVHKVDPRSRYQREELFAPDTCIYTVDTLEEAIALAEDTEYGLACSVFTASRDAYLHVVRGVRAGVINWNRSTVGASGKLPFGGMKRSGNGHPAALYSTLYCTYPVASLEEDKAFDPQKLLPGVTLSL